MSPVAVGLDGLLALLLVLALGLGLKLNARLKALRESQSGFAAAVGELNQAAARAEAGLAALKTASESTHDDLLARIETARGLIGRLERAGAEAQRAAALPDRPTGSPRPLGGTLAAIAALAEGHGPERTPPEHSVPDRPPASDRLSAAPRARRPPKPAFDDDLFEGGPPSRLGPLHTSRGDR